VLTELQEGWFEQLTDNITVLIVDDSSVMRKIVERSLRQAGLEIGQVLEAGNGLEALAVLNQQKVNLVPCDINMPAMNGLEFVKQLPNVENARGVPVVMITTEGSEGYVVQALSASIDKGSLIETLINGSSRRNFLSNSSAYEITFRSADLCGAWNRLRRCVRP
jgi:two-component system, chemotaxis family, chemotaxis protein CheY